MNESRRYVVRDVIGSGGMATVWRADDTRLSRVVALKRPHPAPPDSDVIRRFEREARTAATVSHPNLVAVYDVGADETGPYLVMEYIDAPSLANMQSGSGTPDIALVGAQVAAGLSALHAAGIVHGDVKPANILMAPQGAKLTDFGVARPLDSPTLTQPGVTHGTPAYAPPELLRTGERSTAGDVFSLGAVLSELVTGTSPMAEPTRTAVMVTDPRWRALIEAAMASDPSARPSADALRRQLSSLPSSPVAATEASFTAAAAPSAHRATRTHVPAPPPPARRPVGLAAEVLGRRQARRRIVATVGTVTAALVIAATALALSSRDAGVGSSSAPPQAVSPAVTATTITPSSAPPTTASPTTVPTTTASTAVTTTTTAATTTTTTPPTTTIDATARIRNDLIALVASSGALDERDQRDLMRDVDDALAEAADDKLDKSRRELDKVLDRIDKRMSQDSLAAEAAALVVRLGAEIGVDVDELDRNGDEDRDDD